MLIQLFNDLTRQPFQLDLHEYIGLDITQTQYLIYNIFSIGEWEYPLIKIYCIRANDRVEHNQLKHVRVIRLASVTIG